MSSATVLAGLVSVGEPEGPASSGFTGRGLITRLASSGSAVAGLAVPLVDVDAASALSWLVLVFALTVLCTSLAVSEGAEFALLFALEFPATEEADEEPLGLAALAKEWNPLAPPLPPEPPFLPPPAPAPEPVPEPVDANTWFCWKLRRVVLQSLRRPDICDGFAAEPGLRLLICMSATWHV